MIDDAVAWNELAALLPEAEAEEVRDCWNIGEQEAGLGLLVSGLLAHHVPISETVRVRIAVLAEVWGEREELTPRLLQCRGDGGPAVLRLLGPEERPHDRSAAGASRDPAGLVLVPWIACTGCEQVLMRAHHRESRGVLSYLADHYAIASPDRTTVLQVYPDDAAGAALAALRAGCDERDGPADGR